MISILGGISWKSLTGSTDDDWIDRANHLWTVCLLLLFAVVVSSGQYVGDPIHCWCPAEFTGTFVAYTKHYCWIANTYYVPIETGIPRDIAARQKAELNYYQWVPLILVFMAFMFKSPYVIWHLLNTKSGINLNKINELTDSVHICKPEDRQESLSHIAKYIDRWLRQNRNYHRNIMVKVRQRLSNVFIFCFARRDGYFLTGFYLFTKVLYCGNCVAQFFILDSFLAMDYGGYGFEILSYFREHGEWKETPRFPKVTLCDFKIRQLENIQTFTVQCVLPINLFNEKIFALVWFWLFFLAILTFYNLSSWLFYIIFRNNKELFVRKYLRACCEIQSGYDKKLSRRFANEFLREDGCFLFRMVGKNSTDIILSDLMQLLWRMFRETPFQNRKNIHDLDDADMPLPNDLSSPTSYRGKSEKKHTIMKKQCKMVKTSKETTETRAIKRGYDSGDLSTRTDSGYSEGILENFASDCVKEPGEALRCISIEECNFDDHHRHCTYDTKLQHDSTVQLQHDLTAQLRHSSTGQSHNDSAAQSRLDSTAWLPHYSSSKSHKDLIEKSRYDSNYESLEVQEDSHEHVDEQCFPSKDQELFTSLHELSGSYCHSNTTLDKVSVQETGNLDIETNKSSVCFQESGTSSNCRQDGNTQTMEHSYCRSKSECINKICCASDRNHSKMNQISFIDLCKCFSTEYLKSTLKHIVCDSEKSNLFCKKGDTDTKLEIDIGKYSKESLSKIVSELAPDFKNRDCEYAVFPVSAEIVTTQQQQMNSSLNMPRFEPLKTIIDRIANGETVPPQTSMRYEMLRFCTLRSFPKEDKPFITRIAEAGFYYANNGDEVICYCCAKRKRNWRKSDNPIYVHRQMSPNCSFLNRNAEVNVPIKHDTERSAEESSSTTDSSTSRRHFESSPRHSSQNRIESTTGYNTSVTHSSSLCGANRDSNVAIVASVLHSVPVTGSLVTGIPAASAATSVSSLRRGNQSLSIFSVDVPEPLSENQPSTVSSGGVSGSSSTRPKHPKYDSTAVRLSSFIDCEDLVITPDRLAEAGFFYASFGDCVRCFNCGLGLRHWSAEDDPWIEHSRWSKECTYVQKMKGPEFVRIVQMAVEYNQNNSENEATLSQENQGAVGGHSTVQTDNLMHTDAAQSVLEMGYHPDIIRRAIRMIDPSAGGDRLIATKLMEKIFEIEESENQAGAIADEPEAVPSKQPDKDMVKTSIIESRTSSSNTSEALNAHLEHFKDTGAVGGDSHATNKEAKVMTTPDVSDKDTSVKSQNYGDVQATSRSLATQSSQSNILNSLPNGSCPPSIRRDSITSCKTHLLEQRRLKEENKNLKQQSICTKCKKKDVSIVFLPCGHLITCDVCAPSVMYCMVDSCRKYIKGTVRTYLA